MSNEIFSILAQGGAAPEGAAGILGSPIIMIVVMFAMMYFLIIRPQQKQKKELETKQSSLEKGDKVVTAGGLHGTVHQVSDKTVTLKPGGENVFLTFEKSSIQTVNKLKSTKDDSSDVKKN